MGYLGATLTQVFTRMRGRSGRVTQRCHNSPDRKRGYRVRVTSRTESARRSWRILKKSFCQVENWTPNKKGRLSGLAEARRICALRADEKDRIERMCIYLPYVKEPLNSKVIKSFVSELKSRKCFSCFEIPMFYVCYGHSMHVSRSHIMAMEHVAQTI